MWNAHTKLALVRRWLLGPPGWEMPVCEIDLRVGGRYRYKWVDKSRGKAMGMGGGFTDVVKPSGPSAACAGQAAACATPQ